MTFDLEQALPVLVRTPSVLSALLADLSEPWTHRNEGGETWSPFDVVGHLIHGDRADWIPRARIILAYGEARPFEPFDRFAQQEASRGKTLGELLATFAGLRAGNVEALRTLSLTPTDLARTGRHPDLGIVTLGQLLATWVAHDLSHISQITRVMARQYQDTVGPWRAYLSIMNR